MNAPVTGYSSGPSNVHCPVTCPVQCPVLCPVTAAGRVRVDARRAQAAGKERYLQASLSLILVENLIFLNPRPAGGGGQRAPPVVFRK